MIEGLSLLRPDEVAPLTTLLNSSTSLTLLDQAAQSYTSSYLPLVLFHNIVLRAPHQSTFDLCRRFWQCWKCMPEDAKAGRAQSTKAYIDKVNAICSNSYNGLLELVHSDSVEAAFINPDNGQIISHKQLAHLVSEFRLPVAMKPGQPKPVIAISLPNGALIASLLFAVATYYTAAPVSYGPGVGAEQFRRDVLQSGSSLVIAAPADVDRLELRSPWLAQAQVRVLLITMKDGRFAFTDLDGRALIPDACQRPILNKAGDTAVLMFTSGTSGTKKLVPLHIASLVSGVAMIQESWGLTTSSRCLNQMPYNHIGGILRNLFAPIMAGGSVICCSGFDANGFWDMVDDYAPTWYYASPTIHQCILDAGADRPESIARSRITLACNAAGNLLPSLARQLRDTFSRRGNECAVLPSYGMTECMPISTPPRSYKLEKPGTSGVSVGPEISILDGNDRPLQSGSIGRIAVRGAPVFAGYLKEGKLDRSCFTRDGWFDTGDMGYLDTACYLYITGRSKEVINRGGELISPFEVEDAVLAAARDPQSPIFGRVSRTLAFSVSHDVLQEVVGLIVVTPHDSHRPCLKTIQEATKSSLASVKQPVLLVFMDAGVPTNNNKVLRIKLAERLNLPTISDSTPAAQRYYEAVCPPNNTALTVDIPSRPVQIFTSKLVTACQDNVPKFLDFHIQSGKSEPHPNLWLALKTDKDNPRLWSDAASSLIRAKLADCLDSYLVPARIEYVPHIFARNADGTVDEKSLLKSAPSLDLSPSTSNKAVSKIIAAFAETLNIPAHSINEQSDFFALGGDSMKAGRLLSALRKAFVARIAIDQLFANSTVAALATVLQDKLKPEITIDSEKNEKTGTVLPNLMPGCTRTHNSTNILLMLLQLIPICILAPMRRALMWTWFIYCLTYSQTFITGATIPGRFINLVMSLLIGKIIAETTAPIIAIILKWLIIGRYREGLYPMWGPYHTRWWLVQKILTVGGLGIYEYTNFTRILYYRCLGAQIGRNVSIHQEAKLGEYDLISIGDGVVLDACSVRPFAAELNTSMYLGRIRIGMGGSVGLASVVAAGTIVPAGSCIGPNSSSWEVKDADESNRELSASEIASPSSVLTYLVGLPIFILANFLGALPWMGGLFPLIISEPRSGPVDQLRETIIWFSSPHRVVFHYLALALNNTLGPLFFFFAVVMIKKMLDNMAGGKMRPGPGKNRSQLDKLRGALIRALMPDKQFHKLTNLFGTHYEATSFFARMMGAKVGKYVYWPGKGPSIQDWDMLDIGDSVVFGSRSHIVTSDGNGTKIVKIGNGAMVADRVVLLPGAELGERAIMGSGALSRRDKLYPADTTWVGSKANDAVCLKAETPTHNKISFPALGHRAEQYRKTMTEPVSMKDYVESSGQTTPLTPYDSRSPSMFEVEKYGHVEWADTALPSMPKKTFNESKVTIRSVTVRSVSSTSVEDFAYTDKLVDNSSTPFGRAFYQGQAPYRVWSQTTIALYSTFITVITAVFWNIHSISAIQVVAWLMKQDDYQNAFLQSQPLRPLIIYGFFSGLIAIVMGVQIFVVLSTIVAAKWILMGRRKQGNYDWDKSPYCQRWQLLLKIEALRQKCYAGHGILGMLTGTNWIVLYFRALGANIGKDCALFASGTPSLYFTEPDLLTLGDRVSVDDASLVCHINTGGKFDLNPLSVGDRSVLRSGSRLLSGAKMEIDTCLLEHTLVMAGDVVDAQTTRQGWPSEEFKGNRLPTMRVAYHWEIV